MGDRRSSRVWVGEIEEGRLFLARARGGGSWCMQVLSGCNNNVNARFEIVW
jgi:hypothetical protein